LALLIASAPKARAYLAKQTAELRAELRRLEHPSRGADADDAADLRFALALYVEASGGESALEEASSLVRAAVADAEASSDGCPGRWRAEASRISKLLAAAHLRATALANYYREGTTSSTSSLRRSPPVPVPPRPIPRVTEAELSCADFAAHFARPGVPVIVTGGAAIVTRARSNGHSGGSGVGNGIGDGGGGDSSGGDSADANLDPWRSFDGLAAALKGVKAPLKVALAESRCWAKLEEGGECSDVGAFVASVGRGAEARGGGGEARGAKSSGESSASATAAAVHAETPPRYLHDWSLPRHAPPRLALSLTVPKWFGGDLLPLLGIGGERLSTAWPSLFVGPKGTTSATHTDSGGSHFWMALLHGQKHWRIFPREDAGLLYPVRAQACLPPPTPPRPPRLPVGGISSPAVSTHPPLQCRPRSRAPAIGCLRRTRRAPTRLRTPPRVWRGPGKACSKQGTCCSCPTTVRTW
jgi:hypothetical protein